MEYSVGAEEIEILSRCKENLNSIVDNGGYEFTQTLSNFITELIIVRDERKADRDALSKHNLSCNVIYDDKKNPISNNTASFIRHLRNACCHNGFEFFSKDGQIDRVIFTDKSIKIELSATQIENTYNYLLSLYNI